MVYPDFDMFQSHNPNGVFHALSRTINNGPIYLTDNPGEQNFDILNRIVFADGRTIRSETPLLPTEDCLFLIQKPKVLKAFSKVGNKGLLSLWNAADANRVEGRFKAADVSGIKDEAFAVYEYFSQKLRLTKRDESFAVSLPRFGYQLQYVVPVKNSFAAYGLVNKYNAPATIIKERWTGKNQVTIQTYEGGSFKAYAARRPSQVLVNGTPQKFSFKQTIISFDIAVESKKPLITITW